VVASGTVVHNLGHSKDRERPGYGLWYRDTEPWQQQGQGEARIRPLVQGYRTLAAARTGRGQEAASGTGLQNLGSSKDRERPGYGLWYRIWKLGSIK
jgi:hypothetical protein